MLVTLTEFGRTVRENGDRGTDHGHASVSFVMGGAVRGGKVDLALTTDFRDLLAEVLVRRLGIDDLATVFPGRATAASAFPGVIRG